MDELTRRHALEERWHDEKTQSARRSRIDPYSMGALDLADDCAWTRLGNVSGKMVVEFGCGGGHHAIRLARQGATVYAFDISLANVQTARRNVSEGNLPGRVFVDKMAAEQLAYPDEFADLAFGHSILHHTDLALTRHQVYRILKPGGKAVFIEPLGHNPLIRAFRALTPSRRTPTERPLRFEDVLFLAEPFSSFCHSEFYLVTLAAFLLPLRSRKLLRVVWDSLGRVDNILLAHWHGLRKHAWVIVMELVK
jgi:SAM-dependent methyltransferase